MRVSTTENITLDLRDLHSSKGGELLNINTRVFDGNIEITISQGVESAKLIFEPSTALEVSKKLLSEAKHYE